MHPNAKFQSAGTTSDFGTKFAQNYMNDKTFEKINIKIVINIWLMYALNQMSVNLENNRF